MTSPSKQPWLNKIHHENCITTMSRIAEGSIDLVLTSPPYDNFRVYDGSAFTGFESIAKELYRIIKPGGVVVWIVGDQTKKGNESGTSFKQALYFKEIGFNLFDTMIYGKTPRGATGNKNAYWKVFEYMFVLAKGKPKTINLIQDRENKEARKGDNGTRRTPSGELRKTKRGGYGKFGRRTNIWTYNVGNGHQATDKIAKEHPAVFPESLAQDHVITWTNPGDIVYDPFCGSGTTPKICIQHGRNYLGSEISLEYCGIIKRRLLGREHKTQLDLFDNEEGDDHAKV